MYAVKCKTSVVGNKLVLGSYNTKHLIAFLQFLLFTLVLF